jgi:FtsH-binding integral membrane protein
MYKDMSKNVKNIFFINVWRKNAFDIYFTGIGAALTTVLPVLFKHCYKYCYSYSRRLWVVMKGGGLALWNLIQPTISLEMPVPSQGHYGFHSFRMLTDLVCLYTYEFWLSIVRLLGVR